MQTKHKMEPESPACAQAMDATRLEPLERLLVQRALRRSEQPGLAARTLSQIESRALARRWLGRRGVFKRLLTPRERTTLSAVAAGTSREISGLALALLHLLSAPAWRVVGAALIGAACAYTLALSAHGVLAGLPGAGRGGFSPLQLALGLCGLGALAGALAAQAASVRAYVR